MKAISGIKPTGRITLGNYLGSLKHFKEYQNKYTPYIFVADIHALTLPIDPNEIRERTYDLLSYYLASGLDIDKTVLFKQSDILEVGQLNSIIINFIYMGELSRMTQFKQKSLLLNQEAIGVGLFTYPVLMAADLYLYDCDVCPVGEDQVQHVELAREIERRFNKRYQTNILKTPKAIVSKTGSRIKSLSDPTKKMSKSDDEHSKGVIYMDDDLNVARKKIMSAVTDMDSKVFYDPINKQGISNLMEIYACLKNISIEQVDDLFKQCTRYGDFKKEVADCLISEMQVLQERFKYYRNNKKYLDEIFEKNAGIARKSAQTILNKVEKVVGLK